MNRYRVIFYRVRRDPFGKLFTSPKTISVYAERPEQAGRSARTRLPWRDCKVTARIFSWDQEGR